MEKAAYFGPLYPVLHQLTQGWYVPQYGAAFLSLLLIHSAPMYQCLLRAKSYTWGTPAHISCWYMTYCTTFPLQCKSNAQLCKSMGHSPLIIWWEDKSTTQCAQDSQTGERWRHFLIKPREETFIFHPKISQVVPSLKDLTQGCWSQGQRNLRVMDGPAICLDNQHVSAFQAPGTQ